MRTALSAILFALLFWLVFSTTVGMFILPAERAIPIPSATPSASSSSYPSLREGSTAGVGVAGSPRRRKISLPSGVSLSNEEEKVS
jgi:hypothetical protein